MWALFVYSGGLGLRLLCVASCPGHATIALHASVFPPTVGTDPCPATVSANCLYPSMFTFFVHPGRLGLRVRVVVVVCRRLSGGFPLLLAGGGVSDSESSSHHHLWFAHVEEWWVRGKKDG